MEVNQNEVWPYNLLCRIFDQEDLVELKANAPKELAAFLAYTVRDVYSDFYSCHRTFYEFCLRLGTSFST